MINSNHEGAAMDGRMHRGGFMPTGRLHDDHPSGA